MYEFHDRTAELEALRQCWESPDAQLLLLYGRRRIGKTYLLQHFLEDGKPHCYFLAAQTSLAENLAQLAEAVLRAVPGSGYTSVDLATLNAILMFVGKVAARQRFALVLDEFQYLAAADHSIPSQLQAWWDSDGIRSSVFLVLCGSQTSLMEGLGGPQNPLFGRFTFRYKLPPMNYRDIAQFYASSSYSVRDKLTAYGAFGGTPRYHALLDRDRDLAWNVCRHVLSPLGLLRNEPEVLLSSSRVRDAAPYNAVLRAIAEGRTKPNEMAQAVRATAAQISFYLRGLQDLEWIARESPFGEPPGRRAVYRIADHFLRFWYRFVAGLRSELEFREPEEVYRASVAPNLNQFMGSQAFEDICRQYLQLRGDELTPGPIRRAGRYWSRDGRTEIDLMAELADGRFLFAECKWSSSRVDIRTYYQLRGKVASLPETRYRQEPHYALFSPAGFADELRRAADHEGILLVSGDDLLG